MEEQLIDNKGEEKTGIISAVSSREVYCHHQANHYLNHDSISESITFFHHMLLKCSTVNTNHS